MKDSVNSISSWISILYRYRRNFIMKRLENYGAMGRLYALVMAIYHNNGFSQEQISEILKTDKASIARSVKKLEEEGYVTREPNTSDKRANKLYLTEKAQSLVPEIQKAVYEWEHLIVADVPRDNFLIIEHYLEQMADTACNVYKSYTESE